MLKKSSTISDGHNDRNDLGFCDSNRIKFDLFVIFFIGLLLNKVSFCNAMFFGIVKAKAKAKNLNGTNCICNRKSH
jgi:hypothetical protein